MITRTMAIAVAVGLAGGLAIPCIADESWVPADWKVADPAGWKVERPAADKLAAKQHLKFNNGAEPETLDPQLMTGVPEHTIAMAMFEGLTNPHPRTLEPRPGVAVSWAISPCLTCYRFRIREGLTWSNGDPLTAEDFVRSWKRVLDPKLAAQYAYQLYPLLNAEEYNKQVDGKPVAFDTVGVKAIDTLTLDVKLKAPTPYFLQLTYFETLFPVHVATIEKHGIAWTRPENIVTNGPFRLVDHKPRQHLKLAKSETYWDRANVALTEIEIDPADDTNASMNRYLNDELDWIRAVPASRIDEAKKHPDYFVQAYLGAYFYAFNVKDKPFDDVRVRRAFSLATHRAQICRDVLKSGEIPATRHTPPGIHGYPDFAGDDFDPIAARKLIGEAGYPDGKGFPEVELLYNTNESHKLVAEAIVSIWKQALGVTVKLRNAEWKVYLDEVDHLKYQVARRGWIGDYGDPNTFLDMFVTGGGNNNTGWSNAQYDELIKQAAVTADPAARMKVFEKAERILIAELPILPIYHYVNKGFKSPLLKGWFENVRDLHPFQHMYMVDE